MIPLPPYPPLPPGFTRWVDRGIGWRATGVTFAYIRDPRCLADQWKISTIQIAVGDGQCRYIQAVK